MAFWLAIHKENVNIAQRILDFDPTIRYLTVLAINGKNEPKPKPKKKKQEGAAEETPGAVPTPGQPVQAAIEQEGGELGDAHNLVIPH